MMKTLIFKKTWYLKKIGGSRKFWKNVNIKKMSGILKKIDPTSKNNDNNDNNDNNGNSDNNYNNDKIDDNYSLRVFWINYH